MGREVKFTLPHLGSPPTTFGADPFGQGEPELTSSGAFQGIGQFAGTGGLWIALVLLAAVLLGAALWLWRAGRAGRAEAHRQEREGAALAALMGEGPAAILWWTKGESCPL